MKEEGGETPKEQGRRMKSAGQGVFLFLFIPLVLSLYLRQPFGPGLSIALGLVIMVGHRFVAAPWMLHHATARCLWCGGAVQNGSTPFDSAQGRHGSAPPVTLRVAAGSRMVALGACSEAHADHAARFLTFIYRWRVAIGLGIFVPLVVLLGGSLALAGGRQLLSHEWNTWQFRTVVAFTVVTTSVVWHTVARPSPSLRSPFPLHNLFLLGIRNTLWVFRLVGTWWLVAGILQILA
jgi:hypothetical protein